MDLVSDPLVLLNISGNALSINQSINQLINPLHSQLIYSQLAALPMCHIIASVDHIRSNLLFSTSSLREFDFVYEDVTTFEPYFYEKMYMTQVSQSYR